MIVRIYKGRKINKILCLSLLIPAVISLAATGFFTLADEPAAAHTFALLAMITGGFSLLYGFFWLLYGRMERKTELALKEILERQEPDEDPYRIDYREFVLPKARLIEKAEERFRRIVRWTEIVSVGSFVLIGGIQLVCGSLKSPLQLLYSLIFCAVIAVPGVLVQLRLYLKYAQSVPSRILLFPGKLVVDGSNLSAREIREIRVSPERVFNRNSPDVFREMLIRTEKSSVKYRMDFRTGTASGETPFWEEYGQFVEALSDWGRKNRVTVIVSYMA
jgi:hypothetical protein